MLETCLYRRGRKYLKDSEISGTYSTRHPWCLLSSALLRDAYAAPCGVRAGRAMRLTLDAVLFARRGLAGLFEF